MRFLSGIAGTFPSFCRQMSRRESKYIVFDIIFLVVGCTGIKKKDRRRRRRRELRGRRAHSAHTHTHTLIYVTRLLIKMTKVKAIIVINVRKIQKNTYTTDFFFFFTFSYTGYKKVVVIHAGHGLWEHFGQLCGAI